MDSSEPSNSPPALTHFPSKNNLANTPFVSCLLPLASATLLINTIATHGKASGTEIEYRAVTHSMRESSGVVFH